MYYIHYGTYNGCQLSEYNRFLSRLRHSKYKCVTIREDNDFKAIIFVMAERQFFNSTINSITIN